MKKLSIMILVILMVVGVAMAESTARYDEAAELINIFADRLKEDGIIVLSREITVSEDGKSYDCEPFRGVIAGVYYRDEELSHFSTTVDLSNTYAHSSLIDIWIAQLAAFPKLSNKDIGMVIKYLVANLEDDPIFGRVAKMSYEGYQYNLTRTITDISMFYIYPSDQY